MAYGLMPDGSLAEIPGDLFGIVEEINFRWPSLTVQYLNPERANIGDAPYRIVENTPNGPMFVCSVWELDRRLIDRLHLMNSANVDVVKELEKHNAKVKKAEQAKAEETLGEGADLARSAVEHFGKGKIKFEYTNDAGQKRVVTEYGAKDKTTEVL